LERQKERLERGKENKIEKKGKYFEDWKTICRKVRTLPQNLF
jgi:hypothetical protein